MDSDRPAKRTLHVTTGVSFTSLVLGMSQVRFACSRPRSLAATSAAPQPRKLRPGVEPGAAGLGDPRARPAREALMLSMVLTGLEPAHAGPSGFSGNALP